MNKVLTNKELNELIKKYNKDMVITFFINDIIKLTSEQKKILGIGGIR